MKAERADLISEIREQDKKLMVICKPFGGYRNIVEIDDIHFEDGFLTPQQKQRLAVQPREQQLNVQFNMMASSMGLKNTKWARLTIMMFGAYALGTSFICF